MAKPRAGSGLIEVGIGLDIVDSFFTRGMKDYRKMSRAELLEGIEKLKSTYSRRTSVQRKKSAAALQDQEARLRAILETAVEGIITINERGLIESVNRAAERLFGYKERELIGKNVSVLMPSPHHERHDAYLKSYRKTGHAKIIGIGREVSGRRKNGTLFPMDLAVSEVKLMGRRIFTGFIRDITQRKESEKALLHYAAMVESSDDAIIGKTLTGQITSWNKGAEKVFGYSTKETVGKSISILIPPDRANEEPSILKRIREGESVEHYETVRKRKDGKLIAVSVTVSPIRDAEGKVIGASKVARDITERKELEKQILEISEREQRRIGYDLHDGLCQQLAGIELMSQVLEQQLAKHSKPAADAAGKITEHVRDAIGHTRSLARGLSPVTLEMEGLMSALHELAANTKELFRIECRLDCDPPVQVHDPQVASNLFRIAQEAVSNAIRHGKAKRISISLHGAPDTAILCVNDNGKGLSPKSADTKGMGLRVMRSRAALIGGTLAIERSAVGGVMVVCSAPNRPKAKKANHAR